jgi:hypothetical protein
MKKLLLAVAMVLALLMTFDVTANAMQGFSTCHGPGTTVTTIDGLGTSRARMLAIETLPDALEACHRNERLTGASLTACALKEMRANYKNETVADCEKGTLSNASTISGQRNTEYFRFPLREIYCANDGQAAINAFRTLCPDYEGKLGDEQ